MKPTIQRKSRSGFSQGELDKLKQNLALAVVRNCSAGQIRAKILGNLFRWKNQGMWVTAYDEWHEIAVHAGDDALLAAMLGSDDTTVRLRQSMPFVGLLPAHQVRQLHEEAAG